MAWKRIGIAGLVVAATLAIVIGESLQPVVPEGAVSRARYAPGPYPVGERDFTLIDTSRSTPPNADFEGAPTRSLETRIWYPADAQATHALRLGAPPPDRGPHPLVVYSHGFMSRRSEPHYLAEFLASHGSIVVSADFPLSHFGAPGGPTLADVANQPGDLSFLIDTLMAWSGDPANPFHDTVDPARIAAVGLSLGGLTTTLVAFHPELRDPRIRAAVSIAGPVELFDREFFGSASIPFLMIAGDIDAMVDYETNAARLLERAQQALLVTLPGASHAGFASWANLYLGWFDNPDRAACFFLRRGLVGDENSMPDLGSDRLGTFGFASVPPCSDVSLPPAMAPAQQQVLTTLAVSSFLESVFGTDQETRSEAARFLARGLAEENPGVRVEFNGHRGRRMSH